MTHLPQLPGPRRAVVLVNLGTPDAPTPEAIRRYYREFLNDPRVVDLNPVVRAALVNLIIPVLGAATFTHLFHRLQARAPSRR